ncbi:MAG TPA: hypothetical protein VI524_09015 [Anaerolineales bacterium]|nr:hypothetical protein [Anaerolineales bacterium]
MDTSDEKKPMLHGVYRRETFFLPPLRMVLTSCEAVLPRNEQQNNDTGNQEKADEKTVARLIEKLSQKEKQV